MPGSEATPPASAPVGELHLPGSGALRLVPMSRAAFTVLSRLVQDSCGIKMPEGKKTMLEARVRKRLRALGLETFEEYCDYVVSREGLAQELVHLQDVVSTNKTDFFREGVQFDYLSTTVLPGLVGQGMLRNNTLRAWSAGCATGEEPYTLAMVLAAFGERCADFHFQIVATDLSVRVLQVAARATYREEHIDPVPLPLRHRYILRSRDRRRGLVRVVPELRDRVRFQRLNLREPPYEVGAQMHLVFLRNVLIYFEREFQQQVLSRLCDHLVEGGYLFLGHTESVHGMNLPVTSLGSSVYRKSG
jgi:chemotaxis protein methyltransferase CheR